MVQPTAQGKISTLCLKVAYRENIRLRYQKYYLVLTGHCLG